MLSVVVGGQGINREVSLNLKHGIEAKNYDDVRSFHYFNHFPMCNYGITLLFAAINELRYFYSWQIAKAEQLKPLEVELKRLEDLSDQIVSDFKYMRKREEEMRDTNGV